MWNDTRQTESRIDNRYAVAGQFIGDTAQQRVVVAAFNPGEKPRAAQIRAKVAKQPDLANTAGHYRLGHAGFLKRPDDLAQLADIDPGKFVDVFFQRCIGLLAMRHGHHRVALTFSLLGKDHWEFTVAGDQSDLAYLADLVHRCG